jgi:phospholipid/cholesterol/gamma-HCH transport system substrate-binding protein
MKITGSAIKLGIVSLVLLLITVSIVVVFAQMRFNRTNSYSAEFSNASGLKDGQFVRASGVEIGKVKKVRLVGGGTRVRVDFAVDRSIPLYQSTTAQIRYLDLFANRYLELKRGEGEGAERVLPPGGFIPLSRTSPVVSSPCSGRSIRKRSTPSRRPSSPCFRVRAAPSTTSSTRPRR